MHKMRNIFNSYPVLYKIIVVVICFLLVLIYNTTKANDIYQKNKKIELIQKL